MFLEQHLFLRLSLGFVWKMLSLVGKHQSFYLKDVCSFSVFFFLNEKELNQQVCLIKYVEISNPYLTKKKRNKKERERGAKT